MTDRARPTRVTLTGQHPHSAVSSPFGLVIGGVLAFALALVTVLVTLAGTATTTASAASFTYDTPTIARVDAHQFVETEFSPTQLRDVRKEQSASPSAEARGSSTTRLAAVVATEAGASNAANGVRLNEQLTAEEISGGHAFDKHVIDQGEFPGITTRSQFAQKIESVIRNGEAKSLSGGRTAWWDSGSGTVVIRNPGAVVAQTR